MIRNKCKVDLNQTKYVEMTDPKCHHLHNPSKTLSKWSDPNVIEDQ